MSALPVDLIKALPAIAIVTEASNDQLLIRYDETFGRTVARIADDLDDQEHALLYARLMVAAPKMAVLLDRLTTGAELMDDSVFDKAWADAETIDGSDHITLGEVRQARELLNGLAEGLVDVTINPGRRT